MEPLQVALVELIPVAMQWAALVTTEYQITFTDHSTLTPVAAEAVVITISHQMLLDLLAAMVVEQDAVTQQQVGRQMASMEAVEEVVVAAEVAQDLLVASWAVKVDRA
jgi:hypothetical protein